MKMTTMFETGGFVLPSCPVAGRRERAAAGAMASRSVPTAHAAAFGPNVVDVPTPMLVRLAGAYG